MNGSSNNFRLSFLFIGVILVIGSIIFCADHTIASSHFNEIITGKSKPGWFWNQPVNCGMTAAGIARHSVIYPENSKKAARENGIHNYMRQIESLHTGGQAFSITERGAVWLGDDQVETYDETRLEELTESLPLLDYQVAGNLALVLLGPETCRDETANRKRPYPLMHRPAWVDRSPSARGIIYAVGTSVGYYYSESSWERAEREARRNLSASIQSRIHGLTDQQTGMSHEIIYTDHEVTLRDAVVQSRYYDQISDLYYVLVRMPLR